MLAAAAAWATLAACAPVWHLAGRATQALRLPAITGIMLAGVASGPHSLGLLGATSLPALAPLSSLCLSLIALSAGAELHVPELRRLRRQVACVTAGVAFFSWLLVYTCMRLMASSIPFTKGMPGHEVVALCTLVATLAVARSPASAIAVLKETEGKGSYCSLVMAVVVVKDVLLFMMFAVNIELSRAVGDVKAEGDGDSAVWLVLVPTNTIMQSVLLGAVAGYLLSRLLRMRPSSIISIAAAAGAVPTPAGGAAAAAAHPPAGLAGLLRHPGAARLRPAAPLFVSGLTFGAAEALGVEPLLACVAAGLVASNWRADQQHCRDAAELLSADLTRLAPLINAVFFGLVGASLKLSAVRDSLWAAAILYAVRLAGVWLGCWTGARLGGTPPEIGRRLWMGMVTQAGIALGLAQSVAARFPTWGPDCAALVAGVVVMNLLTGPPLFKAAVLAAGEARALLLPVQATELQHRRAAASGSGSGAGGVKARAEEAGTLPHVLPKPKPIIPIIRALPLLSS